MTNFPQDMNWWSAGAKNFLQKYWDIHGREQKIFCGKHKWIKLSEKEIRLIFLDFFPSMFTPVKFIDIDR